MKRFALPAVLALALAIRVFVIWTQTYVLWVDETFQYLEQGHRLAFGAGLVPWEFQDGVRSWLLPGLIAGAMRAARLMSDQPLVYLRLIRMLCATLSLAVVWTGFRAGQRRDGLTGALVTGGLCAVWFDLVYFSPAVLTEILAAHCAILAIAVGQRDDAGMKRALLIAGGLFGLAFCLRYQYAPALLTAAAWRHRLDWRAWRWLAAGGLAVVMPAGGLLDWVTWGTPFQSIWLHFARNTIQGVSAGMGTEPAPYYLEYLVVSLRPFPLLAVPAILGAIRFPALGLAAAVTLLVHTLIPHKEVRFIYLTIAAAPILIGLGVCEVTGWLRARRGGPAAALAGGGILSLMTALSFATGTGPLGPRWQFERANMTVFLAAHDAPGLCGLAVRDVWLWETGGYTYLDRDVPLYLADDDPGLTLPGTDRKLNLIVVSQGRPVPRIDLGRPGASSARYSHMIAKQGTIAGGYRELSCFDDAARHGEPPICLFRRPGGCSAD